MKVKYGLRGW